MKPNVRLIAAEPLENWIERLINIAQEQIAAARKRNDETETACLLGWKYALIEVQKGIKRSATCN